MPTEGVIAAGKHAYPFTFQIPYLSAEGQKLSGSFCYKTEYGYHLSGERPGAEIRDAKAKIECAPLLSPQPFQGARRSVEPERARLNLLLSL